MVETRSSSNNNAVQSNNIYLSKEDIENNNSVIINVMKVLPDILEEIIPLILDNSQSLINANLEKQIISLLFPVWSLYIILVKITFIPLYVKDGWNEK